jgi:hypothetical protein
MIWRRGVLLALIVSAACAGDLPWRPGGRCPVLAVPSTDLPQRLRMRARMSFAIRGREIVFEAVARRVAEEIVVVSFVEYGARLFAVHQRGLEFDIDAPSRELRRLAIWVMDALHRAYWIAPPPSSRFGDPVVWEWGEDRVSEWRHGRRPRREFASEARPHVADITITYPSGARYDHGARVEIHNASCGYEAVIVILEHDRAGDESQPGTEALHR